MNHLEFDRLLKDRQVPSVLLFEGEEEYLKQQVWKSLRTAFLPEGMEELNETILEAPEADALIAAAETLPLLADRRLVLVRDLPGLSGRKEPDEKLLDYLPRVPDTTILVLYCNQKPDGRKKIYLQIKKAGGIVTFSPLRDQALTSFVTGMFHELGKACDARTADYLIFTAGSDLQRLQGEIRKLSAHAGDAPAIHPDSIEALVTPSLESTVYQMVDAVVAGRSAQAFRLLRAQLLSGADRIAMLAMFLRQFRIMQQIRIFQLEKKERSIRETLGLPPFAVEQYIRQANSWTGGQIKAALSLCMETDFAIKSGRLNADGALEMVMLKLLSLRKGS